MLILSDCLTDKTDEGCLKVAGSLAKRLKNKDDRTMIISYGRSCAYSDEHLCLNKLFLNKRLFSILAERDDQLLYIPFASNTLASIVRVLVLSLVARNRVNVLFALRHPMSQCAKLLLAMSGAKVIALSERSFRFYSGIVSDKVIYLKTGVDTEKFVPVADETQRALLRDKYHIPRDKKVLLHVGHLKSGRNLDLLTSVDPKYHLVVVVSSVTEAEKDDALRKQLERRGNITIIETYIEKIQEIYQLADIYLFPVREDENCIDVPLSVMEAAACDLPIVTTEYGELSAFVGNDGFSFIDGVSSEQLGLALDRMTEKGKVNNRDLIKEYDWDNAIQILLDRLEIGVGNG